MMRHSGSINLDPLLCTVTLHHPINGLSTIVYAKNYHFSEIPIFIASCILRKPRAK